MMEAIESQTLVTRQAQAFPILAPVELERIWRFGELRGYAAGEHLSRSGETANGLTVVIKGEVEVSWSDEAGRRHPVVTYGAGSFVGELAQLSGRPTLVDALAVSEVDALVIPPEGLRALFMSEAELGERVMRALILRRMVLLESGVGGPVIIGFNGDPDVIRLQNFLDRNSHPHQQLDPDRDAGAQALVERLHVNANELPLVLCSDGQLLRAPTETELARCLGLVRELDSGKLYDVVIVGSGPAGLAAAVYAGSEGFDVLALDARSFGGQAGASSRIENYLGFPTGISGGALMARAHTQAEKFGVEMAIPDEAAALEAHESEPEYRLTLANGEHVRSRTVVIASGARYRRLDLEALGAFEGKSVHYWASPLEARLCAHQEIVVVGGGNSAGQAIVYLASRVEKIYVLVRGRSLSDSMSQYLAGRVAGLANVELLFRCSLTALEGTGGALEAVRWQANRSDAETRLAVRHLFLFVGADPNTDWLKPSGVALDAKGFLLTGPVIGSPPLETSLPGVFAIGDVRAGSVKRVAAAVGEGAQVVAALHRALRSRTSRSGERIH
jgi:thioredoxin reductase (NADPH)